MDDVITLVIFSICFVVACFSLCVLFYSVRPLRKDIRDEQRRELKEAKKSKTTKITNTERNIQEGPKKRPLWGVKKSAKNEEQRGLGYPLNWVPNKAPSED